MEDFAKRFHLSSDSTVVDLGGSPFVWSLLQTQPQLTFLNLLTEDIPNGGYKVVEGDACNAPFSSKSFDVVFSNSVIEHVGSQEKQFEFARECSRCGTGYYIQTPNKWFPLDLHTFFLFVHWLPERMFRKAVRFSPRAIFFHTSPADLEDLRNLRLLSKKDMKSMFPDAEIIEERFLGLTKSLIAVYPPPCSDRNTLRDHVNADKTA